MIFRSNQTATKATNCPESPIKPTTRVYQPTGRMSAAVVSTEIPLMNSDNSDYILTKQFWVLIARSGIYPNGWYIQKDVFVKLIKEECFLSINSIQPIERFLLNNEFTLKMSDIMMKDMSKSWIVIKFSQKDNPGHRCTDQTQTIISTIFSEWRPIFNRRKLRNWGQNWGQWYAAFFYSARQPW